MRATYPCVLAAGGEDTYTLRLEAGHYKFCLTGIRDEGVKEAEDRESPQHIPNSITKTAVPGGPEK